MSGWTVKRHPDFNPPGGRPGNWWLDGPESSRCWDAMRGQPITYREAALLMIDLGKMLDAWPCENCGHPQHVHEKWKTDSGFSQRLNCERADCDCKRWEPST